MNFKGAAIVKTRKIFIDCGAWTGDSIKEFEKHYTGYEIYGFECESRVRKRLRRLSRETGFHFIEKAVWIRDENVNLYLGHKRSQSSSLLLSKKRYIDETVFTEVEAIDFSKWIVESFDKDDYIICKMNIEGAEYDVLEKMVSDNSIDYIDKLFISWHWKKLEGFLKRRHKKIRNDINKRTNLLIWRFGEDDEGNPYK